MAKLTYRRAIASDAPLLRAWDEEPHVVASDPNDDWHWETELDTDSPWREPFIVEADGRPVGFLDIIDPALERSGYWAPVPSGWRAIDIWIGPADCLGRGFGTQMMRFALERCFAAASVEKVVIDPLARNERAIRFYQRLGFRPIGPRRFGADDCLVHEITRAEWSLLRGR